VKSKTATTIPHSPCEAEIKAMDEATREIVWLRELLEEIGMKQIEPTTVYSDSTAGIDQLSAYKNSTIARHYCRDPNYLRQAVERGIVEFRHIPGDDNRADTLTKNLGYDKFARFSRMIMRGELQ
jgi:hypothetical protein